MLAKALFHVVSHNGFKPRNKWFQQLPYQGRENSGNSREHVLVHNRIKLVEDCAVKDVFSSS